MRDNRDDNYRQNDNRSDSRNTSDLAKIEQEHRHRIEKKAQMTFRSGQFFGFLYNVGILALVYKLITQGSNELALKIFLAHTAFVITIIITAFLGKRKPRGRHQGNRKNYNSNSNNNRNYRK